MKPASILIGQLEKAGYTVHIEGEEIVLKWTGIGEPSRKNIRLLNEVRERKAEALSYLRLLQTPLHNLEAPLLIESDVVEARFSLVGNEIQAAEVEEDGGIAYLPSEVRSILATSAGMDGNNLKGYLQRMHEVKRTFRGARIQ